MVVVVIVVLEIFLVVGVATGACDVRAFRSGSDGVGSGGCGDHGCDDFGCGCGGGGCGCVSAQYDEQQHLAVLQNI